MPASRTIDEAPTLLKQKNAFSEDAKEKGAMRCPGIRGRCRAFRTIGVDESAAQRDFGLAYGYTLTRISCLASRGLSEIAAHYFYASVSFDTTWMTFLKMIRAIVHRPSLRRATLGLCRATWN